MVWAYGQERSRHSWRTGQVLLALALSIFGSACAGGGSTAPQSQGPQLTYNGPTSWLISGPEGGPFVNTSHDFLLENDSNEPVSWSATAVPAFVVLDQPSGTIAAGAQVNVHADLLASLANSLPPGVTNSPLTFHNDSGTQADILIDCTLSIATSGTGSELVPDTDFTFQGPAGGPFQPSLTIYTLINIGSTPLSWQTITADAWLSVLPDSGQLASGSAIDLVVSIDPARTGGLQVGTHPSHFDVRDSLQGITLHTRNVVLNVPPSSSGGGWTEFIPSVDTRRIYVSSSGNDANNGLSEATPKRTIAGGRALLRNGFPDWLLFKKGDVFDGAFSNWNLSGRSLSERMLVSSYGTGARPLIRSGSSTGIYTAGGATTNHVAIVGLHFFANTFTGAPETPVGIAWLGGTQNLLVEDCYVERYATNIVVQGYPEGLRHTNVSLRRNVVVEAYNTGTSNSEGIYVSGTDGLLIEENVLDHNGWVDSIPGSLPTFFRRNVYVQNANTGVVFRGNLLSGTDGAQIRPGGTLTDNFVTRCVCGLQVGVGNVPEPAGITATIRNNVIMEGRYLDSGHVGIFGMRISNLIGGSASGNIIANVQDTTDARAIWFSTIAGFTGRIANNYTLLGNISHDGGNMTFEGLAGQYSNVSLHENVLQTTVTTSGLVVMGDAALASPSRVTGGSNTYWLTGASQSNWVWLGGGLVTFNNWLGSIGDTSSTAQFVNYPQPLRNTASYNASLGGTATHDAFMAQCRLQSKDNWRVEYTAAAVNVYIRAGFGL